MVYPRAYGGNPLEWLASLPVDRSIPARTGEPQRSRLGSPTRWVYPRAYGGTRFFRSLWRQTWGLSPRVRGNLADTGADRNAMGSIPARTGEPCSRTGRRSTGSIPARTGERGLSPRVRGNHRQRRQLSEQLGSIPARTGEPPPVILRLKARTVYPRAYGGTAGGESGPRRRGLSPRVRGNPRLAWALRLRAVYPRAYGGTPVGLRRRIFKMGLSPRVRGNPATSSPSRVSRRSIPARTGEPRGRSG